MYRNESSKENIFGIVILSHLNLRASPVPDLSLESLTLLFIICVARQVVSTK
jgi:hypothetical protein